MKVLHAAETIQGGIATVLRELSNGAAENKDELYLVAPKTQLKEISEKKFTDIISFNRSGRNFRSLISFTLSLIKALLETRPDIVHLHSSFAGLLGRAVLILMRPIIRPKIVYTPHGWSFIMDCSPAKKLAYSFIEKTLLFATDKVICVSNYEKDAATKIGFPQDKLTVIYNGISPPPPPTNLESPFDRNFFNLLFVGRLDTSKGYDIAIDIASKLPPEKYKLTIVGASVINGAEPKKLKNVHYTGWINSKELSNFFCNADALIMPSRWEAFGLVAVEAQCHSLPVIASNRCSLPEVICDGETGFLFDIETPSEAIQIITQTPPSKWGEMRDNSRHNFSNKFTSSKMRESTNALYSKLLRDSHA